MQDRPTCAELLAAVRQFIETDVIPRLEGPERFHARVAANVLAIVQRELATADMLLRAEHERLAALLGSAGPAPHERQALQERVREDTERLCQRIAAGEADSGQWRLAVLAHVRQTVREKLEVANPRYLAADDRLRRQPTAAARHRADPSPE